jgi:CheY-like chemotaxis protein
MPQLLVIEDDAAYREMLIEALGEAGYPVLAAENGEEGIELCRQHHCPLVITDIFMPEKEGLETIRELKHDFPTLKIIAISGGGFRSHYSITSGAENALAAAQAFGANRTLFKPFEIQHLLTLVEELLQEI